MPHVAHGTGDSPSAKRQYDAVLTGCIPVIVSNEALYAYSTENGGLLDPKDFSVRVTEESVVEAKGGKEGAAPKQGGLLQQLEAIDEREVRRLQGRLARSSQAVASGQSAGDEGKRGTSGAGKDAGTTYVERLREENSKLREELSAFDLDFFEEIEDLKFKYAEAMQRLQQYA